MNRERVTFYACTSVVPAKMRWVLGVMYPPLPPRGNRDKQHSTAQPPTGPLGLQPSNPLGLPRDAPSDEYKASRANPNYQTGTLHLFLTPSQPSLHPLQLPDEGGPTALPRCQPKAAPPEQPALAGQSLPPPHGQVLATSTWTVLSGVQ